MAYQNLVPFDDPNLTALPQIEEPPKPKPKRRATKESTPSVATTEQQNESDVQAPISAGSWRGWAELENDPLIFTQLLRDMGVGDVTVDEVIPLDMILEKPPETVLGLVFLSRWTQPETEIDSSGLPSDLWFANQISTFSCATLAIMNIINNRPELDLGPELDSFREQTINMLPKDRGVALDQFQFVKDAHNSFSRELDHLIVDLKLKDDYQAAAKKGKTQKKTKKKRKKRRRAVYEEDESSFHFIAYVPTDGQVWKLDGLEASPRRLGTYSTGENWLHLTVADIQGHMEGPDANAMEFSLLSLMHDQDSTFDRTESARVERMKEDWSPFFAHMLKLHAERGDIDEMLPGV